MAAETEVLAFEYGFRQRCAPLPRPAFLGLLRCDDMAEGARGGAPGFRAPSAPGTFAQVAA